MTYIQGQRLSAAQLNADFAARQSKTNRTDLRHRRVWRPWGFGLRAYDPGSTSLLVALEAEFTAVRVIYANDTATPYTVSAVAVCPTTAQGDGVNPNGGAAWVPVTTSKGGANSPDLVFGGSGRSLTVPAGTEVSPGLAYTDWVPVQSLQRADGGGQPMLLLRSYVAAGQAPRGQLQPLAWGVEQQSGRNIFWASLGSADLVTTPPNNTSASGVLAIAPWAIEYQTRRGLTLLCLGDSLVAGTTTVSDRWSFPLRACYQISTPDLPVTCAMVAFGGKNSADFHALAAKGMEAFEPEAVLIPLRTPNDGTDVASTLARAYALAQTAARRGTIPIFLGPFPQGAVAGGNLEATITAQEQRAKSLIASGSLVFDAMPYLGIPRAFNAGFTIDDLHPNDAGHTALTTPFASVLRSLL